MFIWRVQDFVHILNCFSRLQLVFNISFFILFVSLVRVDVLPSRSVTFVFILRTSILCIGLNVFVIGTNVFTYTLGPVWYDRCFQGTWVKLSFSVTFTLMCFLVCLFGISVLRQTSTPSSLHSDVNQFLSKKDWNEGMYGLENVYQPGPSGSTELLLFILSLSFIV